MHSEFTWISEIPATFIGANKMPYIIWDKNKLFKIKPKSTNFKVFMEQTNDGK